MRANRSAGFSLAGGASKACRFDTGLGPTFAEDVVRADVAVFVFLGVARVAEAPLLFELEKLSFLVFREVVDASQVSRQHQDPTVSIQDLCPPIRSLDVLAKANRSVIGQDNHVRLADEWQDRVGKSLTARRFVLGDRHVSQEHFDFRQHALRNRLTSHSERGRVRWDGSERRSSRRAVADRFPNATELRSTASCDPAI